ncbi:chromosomal replication initiator protein [Bathymodiolus platifrons methanotrophic gill symbiont]|uniref:chromosomal replication initiator protein DnaA n=1 Tax=Bathymodiolus platifrons methanotrophic gill symbiont TaxID=113268 RepID=UPI000B4084E6|nr:chromosomal replication initiator protein DnaA [Bathymodiolus platifrons methanotrophic gill symbiont]MCK5869188.1 chromosomal replication initiator protein DnaA [Methyloprofundus sp.]TXK95970.1 chromosomal replication initiation protein DnaA [Methylococcaceae bacterium CS5]TXK96070.1 chromosomal replication initiation protein DnaA [Methylococcaceae bacterium CS4]TXL05654.1 chromosomal replication initiation protein DnaA [Methylococcaceae bacterium CS1]TXL06203.1 chromosomal replication ini
MSSIWNSCLSRLENEISTNDLNTWIRPLQAQEENDVIKLLAPNQFIIAHVKEQFLGKIEDAVYEFSSGQYTVKMEIGTRNVKPAITANQNRIFAGTPANEPQKKKKKTPTFINTAFTFENFVEGKSNQLAKAASIQVSENIGKAYNPLLIYGASGLGKTHLMHAIGNAILAKNPNANIVYLHSEKFVQDMVKAFQQNSINAFKDYYRNVDALFVDDIQFFAGKERSQEEFFHTFNSLLEKKNQVVLTCDKYPKEIEGLEDRLKSRFGWGLPVAVEPPDLETRAAILMNKAQQNNVELDHEVAFFIGKRIPSNVRDLEGALRRVLANAQFTGADITIDFAKEALHDLISLQDKLVSIDNIQKTVADYFKIRIADLLSKSRKQSVTRPRQIAMSLARELTSHSLPEIGDAFSGRDHTTVINACKRIKALRTSDYKVEEDYANLLRTLSH